MPALVVLILIVLALAIAYMAVAAVASMLAAPLVALVQSVSTAAEATPLLPLAVLSSVLLVTAGMLLAIRMRSNLAAAFVVVRGRDKYLGYLSYWLVVTLIVAGVAAIVSILSPGSGVPAQWGYLPISQLFGALLLIPLAWWMFRRFILRRVG